MRRTVLLLGIIFVMVLSPSWAGAQADVDEIVGEIEAMLGGRGAIVDPAGLVAAELTGVQAAAHMQATAPVAAKLISRADAAAHLRQLFDTQLPPARRLPMQAAWHAMGLLPRDQTLEEAVLTLYGSQIGGFYDPLRDTLFLLDDMPAVVQVPIVRHELVHALQDQHVDLGVWLAGAEVDEDKAAALQAVLEGHANDVMNRAMLGQMGLGTDGLATLDDTSGIMAELRELLGVDADSDLSELLDLGIDASSLDAFVPRDTPAALRAQLLFPYVVGTRFVGEYRAAHPEDPSCSALYARPPRTTAEILNPSRWESGSKTPDISPPGTLMPGWQLAYDSPLGQLLTWVLLTNQADPLAGNPDGARWGLSDHDKNVAVGSGWAGDHVAVYRGTSDQPGSGAPDLEIVAWTSRWSTEAEAREIAKTLKARVPAAQTRVSGARLDVLFQVPDALKDRAMTAVRAWK
jgi:hypothetical protein